MLDKDIQRTKKVFDAIYSYMRKIHHGYLVFHDLHGTKCSFTAETHFHLVSECKHREGKTRNQDSGIWTIPFFQELRDVVKGNMFALKSEQIKYMDNMTGYLKQPPRELIGFTSRAMDIHFAETPENQSGKKCLNSTKRRNEDIEDEEPKAPKRRKVGEKGGQRRPGDRLKVLMELMRKYKRNDIHKLLKEAIRKDQDEDYDTLLDFLAVPSNRIVAQNAAKLLCSSEARTYAELFMDETTEDEIKEHLDVSKLLNVEDSHYLFKKWAKEKRSVLKSGTYWLVTLFAVLFRKVPKRNTFLCVGAASSGKTFWTDPVLWLQQYVGLSANDSHFCFAELAHSKVGLINELKFNRDTLEIYKQIGEGKDCMVPVKNQGLGGCDSQPIIVTVNTEPWSAIPEGKEAMEERSFYFHFNSKSKVLAEHKSENTNKGINPYWLKGVFSVLVEALAEVNIPDMLEKRDFSDPIWRKLDSLLCLDESKDGVYGEYLSSDDEWSSDEEIDNIIAEAEQQIPTIIENVELPLSPSPLKEAIQIIADEDVVEVSSDVIKYDPIVEPLTPDDGTGKVSQSWVLMPPADPDQGHHMGNRLWDTDEPDLTCPEYIVDYEKNCPEAELCARCRFFNPWCNCEQETESEQVLCTGCGLIGSCECASSTVIEAQGLSVCDLCGFEGSCNGGASCQLYAMNKSEIEDIVSGMIECEEDEAKGEQIEIDFDFLLNNSEFNFD